MKKPSRNPAEGPSDLQLRIENLPISDLKLDPLNPRVHSKRQIELLAKSIQSFGFIMPVVVDSLSRVIAGHGRIEAAKALGQLTVPAISVSHLSESQRQAFMIADNRLTEHATWDDKLLGQHFKDLSAVSLDFEIEATGFEVAEIELFVQGLSPASGLGSDPADRLPKEKKAQVTILNDLWLLGRNRVLCGDPQNPQGYSLLIDEQPATMVVTAPRCHLGIDTHSTRAGTIERKELSEKQIADFLFQVFAQLCGRTSDNSLHYFFMDWRYTAAVLSAGKQAYSELKTLCVWIKENGAVDSLYRSQHELVWVFKNGEESHRNDGQVDELGQGRTNVWNYAGLNSRPTVKPVAVVADAIMDSSARGDIVLDPFLSGGTTVIAAERTGRICYGMEIEPKYVDTTVRRWEQFTGLKAVHATSGRTFAEVEQEVVDE
jgi:DNA modification methylase